MIDKNELGEITIGYLEADDFQEHEIGYNGYIDTPSLHFRFGMMVSEKGAYDYDGPNFTIWDRYKEEICSTDMRDPFEIGLCSIGYDELRDRPKINLLFDCPAFPRPFKAYAIPRWIGERPTTPLSRLDTNLDTPLKYFHQLEILWQRED